MVTDINICSNAFVLLGGSPLSSFTEGSTEAVIASQLYKTTYHALLTETLWHFATRHKKLFKHVEKPKGNYSSKFQLPVDLLYVVKCSVDDYEIYERNLHANSDEILIEYVYPVDEVNLPPYFVTALEYTLASKFAIPLTGNTTRAKFFVDEAEKKLRKARTIDASQRPNTPLSDSPYVSARF